MCTATSRFRRPRPAARCRPLRHWVSRLDANKDEIIALVGERTYRIWRLYMTGSAIQFEQGATGVYQILAEGKHDGKSNLPLTRRDLYNTKRL